MPRSTKTLTIPNSGGNLKLNKNQDQLQIHVTQQCQWCYDDESDVFPNFLPCGQVEPGTYPSNDEYYIPEGDGQVSYGCPLTGECIPDGDWDTGHTITVSG
jgi:hypothetical protein